jgi:hypothetical protein
MAIARARLAIFFGLEDPEVTKWVRRVVPVSVGVGILVVAAVHLPFWQALLLDVAWFSILAVSYRVAIAVRPRRSED